MSELAPFRGLRPVSDGAQARVRDEDELPAGVRALASGDREDAAAFYLVRETFVHDGKEHTRRSLFALVKLHPAEDKVVLPLGKAAPDRVAAWQRATEEAGAELAPVLGLYRDPERQVAALLDAAEIGPPLPPAGEPTGERCRIWRVDDPTRQHAVARAFADRRVYIAEGQARYAAAQARGATHTLFQLVALDDPGLVTVAEHRLLGGLPSFSAAELIGRIAGQSFDVREYFYATAKEIKRALLFGGSTTSCVLVEPPATQFHLLSLRRDAAVGGPLVLRAVDASVLGAVLLEQAIGVPKDGAGVRYTADLGEALQAVRDGACQAAVLLNPPPPDQLREVADAGQLMPPHAFRIFPGAAAGLIARKI